MELICPLCNGLYTHEIKCHQCQNSMMIDKGRLTDYYDEYSPYLPMGLTNLVDGIDSAKNCLHLFTCEDCGYDRRVVIDKIPR